MALTIKALKEHIRSSLADYGSRKISDSPSDDYKNHYAYWLGYFTGMLGTVLNSIESLEEDE